MAQAPEQIKPEGLADYLEVMTKAVFQSGMSWRVVEAKWDGFTEAFERFDPEQVAGFDVADIDRLASDTRIIRNRRKIEATVHNADTLLRLDAEGDGFDSWLSSQGTYGETRDALKREFKFLGDFGSYYFLYVVGQEVPPHDEVHSH
ncbi:MAG: DNA-3-methyladenine glycosylase I [Acidimicrobiia bacterium]